jgi:SAM-dependent methyltransferase
MKLNLGCGKQRLDGWINIDRDPAVADLFCDLDAPGLHLPYPCGSVEQFFMSHVLEHLRYPLPCMKELWRVAKPGATLEIRTPHGASDDAWEDQTHVRPYFPNSFLAFGQPYYWRSGEVGYRGDWKVAEIQLLVDPQWVESPGDNLKYLPIIRNWCIEMRALLSAVKPARSRSRELMEEVRCLLVPCNAE